MRDKLTSSFRQDTTSFPVNRINVVDQWIAPNTQFTSLWSPGATIIDTIQPTVSPNQRWKVLSLSVVGKLNLINNSPGTYGKLGKVLIGLSLDELPETIAGGGAPYATSMRPLLPDSTLMIPLWDPAADPLPPSSGDFSIGGPPPTTYLSKEAALLPPVPIDLIPGQSIAIGIWITPSLLASNSFGGRTNLAVWDAIWTVNYDDGR